MEPETDRNWQTNIKKYDLYNKRARERGRARVRLHWLLSMITLMSQVNQKLKKYREVQQERKVEGTCHLTLDSTGCECLGTWSLKMGRKIPRVVQQDVLQEREVEGTCLAPRLDSTGGPAICSSADLRLSRLGGKTIYLNHVSGMYVSIKCNGENFQIF